MTQLQAGEMAPDFKSTTQDGEPLTLADLRGQRTILYFYPKDNTSGCTLEAKSLRDGKAELTRMGFRIVGVSPDSEKSHRNFCDKHELNFTLLADTDHSVCGSWIWRIRETMSWAVRNTSSSQATAWSGSMPSRIPFCRSRSAIRNRYRLKTIKNDIQKRERNTRKGWKKTYSSASADCSI